MKSVINLSIFCFIAFALLGSMVYMMATTHKNEKILYFMSLLDKKQQEIYLNIVKERANIYFQGFVLGLIIGLIYLKMVNRKDPNVYCIFVALVLGVTYVHYTLMPKSTYMLDYLENQEQARAWLQIYKIMKKRCYTGMILGIVALPLVCHII